MSAIASAEPSEPAANMSDNQPKQKKIAVKYPFWFGGSASSMAACVTHPLDLIKVRLQTRTPTAPSNMSGTFINILKSDGILGLYNGLSASLLRQLSYSTVRFGVYEELKSRSGSDPGLAILIANASFSGFLGGIAGNFADVLNVRMQHDASLPVDCRRNYKHAVDGMLRMAREEGVGGYMRGWLPNSSRAAVMTASQLASYDTFKRLLLTYTPAEDNLSTHFSASFLAGLVAATVTSPIDVVKTRVMSSSGSQGVLGVVRDMFRVEGVRWMFKGWTPSFLRLGPHTICTFVFLEFHRKAYRKVQGIDESSI